MSALILVTYATRYGSTQEVAEDLAAALRERGLEVEVLPMREVQALAKYSAVVLGAALYVSHWHKDAVGFLSHHRQELVKMPVAVFALGPVHEDEKEFRSAHEQLYKELSKFPWLMPVSIQIFGGKFDPAKLGFPYNLIPPLKNMPASDALDPTAIHAWANELAAKFQTEPLYCG